MMASDPIPTALAEIASILRRGPYLSRREIYEEHALDIDRLRDAALSTDPEQQAHFRTEITQNKYYWLGMGTIADVSFSDEERKAQFIHAYFALANACEAAGLDSIYSLDARDIFGKMIREGLV